jgi:hypothetical protein
MPAGLLARVSCLSSADLICAAVGVDGSVGADGCVGNVGGNTFGGRAGLILTPETCCLIFQGEVSVQARAESARCHRPTADRVRRCRSVATR